MVLVLYQECDTTLTPCTRAAMWTFLEATQRELDDLKHQQTTLSIKIMMLINKVQGILDFGLYL